MRLILHAQSHCGRTRALGAERGHESGLCTCRCLCVCVYVCMCVCFMTLNRRLEGMGVGVGSMWACCGLMYTIYWKDGRGDGLREGRKGVGPASHTHCTHPCSHPFPPPPLLPSTSIVRRNFGGGSQRHSRANSATYSGMGAKDSSNNLRAGELNSFTR